MLRIEREKKRRVRSGVLVGALVALVLGAGAIYGYDNLVLRAETTGVQSASQVKAQPKPTKVESRMLVMGDTFWGRYTHDWSMASHSNMLIRFRVYRHLIVRPMMRGSLILSAR